jgi:DNA-binding transcriptional regulator YdaS (Cro superfamily)
MTLLNLYKSMTREQREALARAVGTSPAYLSQLAYGHRRAGIRVAAAIQQATDGQVTPADLRPDIFGVDCSE